MHAGIGHAKPQAMFVFGEHAREVITSEVGIWMARLFIDDSTRVHEWPELHEALKRAGDSSNDWPGTIREWVQQILSKLTIKVSTYTLLMQNDARRQTHRP